MEACDGSEELDDTGIDKAYSTGKVSVMISCNGDLAEEMDDRI
jgi:hypothetical protein